MDAPTTALTESEALQEAMRRLEAEDAARAAPTLPTPSTAADDTTSLLEAGKELWDSVGAGMAKAGIETKDFIFGEPEEHEKSDFRRGIERRAGELASSSPANAITMSISQFATGCQ